MPAFVLIKVGGIAEASGTLLALERPVASVNAHMNLEAAGAEERLETDAALVPLLARMFHEVGLQGCSLRKRGVAFVTFEWLLHGGLLNS